MNSKRPIVVLGGMGPQASSALYRLLIEKSSARKGVKNNEDFPHIIIDSLSVPDFINDRSKQEDAVASLTHAVQRATRLNPVAVCIACNTAHVFVEQIGISRLPSFTSLIRVVVQAVSRSGVKKVGLLASPTTIKTRLYDIALEESGIGCLILDMQGQAETEHIIRTVIAGTAGIKEAKALARLANDLHAKGAECVILGCTELPLVFDASSVNIQIFDCLDILSDKLLDTYVKEIGYNKNR